jgi:hypothetical protein
MSPQTIKIIITAILILHGIAHGRAFFTLLVQATNGQAGAWLPVRAWWYPAMSLRAASWTASIFWLLATLAFFASGLIFYGLLDWGSAWRDIAFIGAIISTLASILFSGIWPGAPTKRMSDLDTVISLVVNVAIFVALVVLEWPPADMFGI